MKEYTYQLAVCWRIYPGISKDPLFYKDDKYKLARLSFDSFLKCVEGIRVKYFIILDACPREFEKIFTDHVAAADMEIIRTDKIGNHASFQKQLDILSAQTDAPLVYFAEDDYLYRPGVFKNMLEFFNSGYPVDFITPYDHLDYYEHPIHLKARKEPVISFNNLEWKQAVATCLTFLTSKEILKQTMPVFETYIRGNTDGSLWVSLTRKYGIGSLLTFRFTNKECFFILKKSIKYSFRQFVSGKRFLLWCAMPSIGTHLESKHIAPGVDWEEIKNSIQLTPS
jgi:hypothetical protein